MHLNPTRQTRSFPAHGASVGSLDAPHPSRQDVLAYVFDMVGQCAALLRECEETNAAAVLTNAIERGRLALSIDQATLPSTGA